MLVKVSSFGLAYPYAWLSNKSERYGRPLVMFIGALSFCLILFTFRFTPLDTYESKYKAWMLLIAAHIALGSGITVWQGTAGAVFSDYYSATPEVFLLHNSVLFRFLLANTGISMCSRRLQT